MFKVLSILFSVTIIASNCYHAKREDTKELALIYCGCIEKFKSQTSNLDSITRFCEDSVLSQSRLINILLSEDHSLYNQKTLDSANNLLNEFSKITDTMCLNKANFLK